VVDHRESLIAQRTRLICRLRWYLHELDPAWEPKARSLDAQRTAEQLQARLQDRPGIVARLARELVSRYAASTVSINALENEIAARVEQLAPTLLALPGCGPLTAAKIIARDRRRRPIQIPRRLRPLHRHRATASVVIEQNPAPAEPHRKPSTQRCPTPDRAHPGPMASTGKGPDRPPEERREQRTRGDPHTQTPPLRCRLSSTPPRPNRRINASRLTEEQGTDPVLAVKGNRAIR
jgi:transposase